MRLLFNICCPSTVRWNHPANLMAPHSSGEDHFTYYCSTGMLGVIKHIPYTPLVKLSCSLFLFQACAKSRLDFGFPGPEPSFPHLFRLIFFSSTLLLLCRLYVSPKKQVADPGPESPLKWCRQALDHRSPETEMACRTLLSRLDQSKFTEAVGEKRFHMKTLASDQAPG